MNKNEIMRELNAMKGSSAWRKGVIEYAKEILSDLPDGKEINKANLLNGADSWKQYSYGGCSLIYDEDICKRLCSPSEQKRKKYGELDPNANELWIDVQARALMQACSLVLRLARKESNGNL